MVRVGSERTHDNGHIFWRCCPRTTWERRRGSTATDCAMALPPMISIPRKTTDDVDWTSPIRSLIAHSYGENPDNYAPECAALQRSRQDAVRGAGSDITARDLLYKYFGQLELLELRFSEIKVTFPWHDAFTAKLTTQSSIAFEKASVLFLIAATHSSIAASQSRSDPEGQKRAFHYFRTAAGMLTYINENFLHAPSTDLSRDVLNLLYTLILAQATEVLSEKSIDEKRSSSIVARVAAQAASMYASLSEDVKEFMGKGIFDRNWITLIQIKSKYYSSLSQYHRSLADNAASKHGDALVRLSLADSLAKESLKSASSFSSSFLPTTSPTLPTDAGSAIHDLLKAHAALCASRRADAQRENDLIYNAVLSPPETLPAIEKAVVATPIGIHDVYGTPEVQKTIGPDIFVKLVPLSVHESASVYSEEKAKVVRAEVERCEGAEGERRSVVEGLGVKEGLARFRAMAEGEVGEEEVPVGVGAWREEVRKFEAGPEGVEAKLAELARLREGVKGKLESVHRELEIETRDCEEMRVRYDHRWTMEPSAGLSKVYRQELKDHMAAFEAAAASDGQVAAMWGAVKGEVAILLAGARLEQMFRDQAGGEEHLLDVDADLGGDEQREERAKIGGYVAEIEERMGKLNVLARERGVVLKDLKEKVLSTQFSLYGRAHIFSIKVQTDDVSHLLLLNRRNSSVEPALFAAELEKFKPYQQQIIGNIQQQGGVLRDLSSLWKGLKEHTGRGPGARRWEERERRKKGLVKRFGEARDVYMEVRDGLACVCFFFYAYIFETIGYKQKRSTILHGAGGFDEKAWGGCEDVCGGAEGGE